MKTYKDFAEILIDDIEETVSIRKRREDMAIDITIYSFDEIDALRTRALLASAKGKFLFQSLADDARKIIGDK